MSKEKIILTDDPLTNIRRMIPLLNDKEREAISYLMYGCYIGKKLAKSKKEKNKTPDTGCQQLEMKEYLEHKTN